MIKYHILSLLALALVAFTGIEAAAEFYTMQLKNPGLWYQSGKAWVMSAIMLSAVYFYFRVRKLRKQALFDNKD